jgi:hypothetical protein
MLSHAMVLLLLVVVLVLCIAASSVDDDEDARTACGVLAAEAAEAADVYTAEAADVYTAEAHAAGEGRQRAQKASARARSPIWRAQGLEQVLLE